MIFLESENIFCFVKIQDGATIAKKTKWGHKFLKSFSHRIPTQNLKNMVYRAFSLVSSSLRQFAKCFKWILSHFHSFNYLAICKVFINISGENALGNLFKKNKMAAQIWRMRFMIMVRSGQICYVVVFRIEGDVFLSKFINSSWRVQYRRRILRLWFNLI